MWVVRLRRRNLGIAAIIGVMATIIVNVLLPGQVALDDILASDPAVLAGKTIALDPGHGGIDGGARSGGLQEKDITLSLALKLADELRRHGATVVFTRDSDIDYYTRGKGGKRNDLIKRVALINASGAALFLSIHTNAIKGAQWFGAETYYNPRSETNKQLAEVMQKALADFPPGNKRQARQDSDILVLKDTTIPGVLIEAGFISNPKEAALLADPAYQQKMAQYITQALAYHFGHHVAR
ncbi:MAG TPA: N-acetylmuramoyl-L-alanine amidase [Selenomonadales bacterium]|nr:N-acetylmuramoyl-L-alanine amidase [Selenomonadales bacterium]